MTYGTRYARWRQRWWWEDMAWDAKEYLGKPMLFLIGAGLGLAFRIGIVVAGIAVAKWLGII